MANAIKQVNLQQQQVLKDVTASQMVVLKPRGSYQEMRPGTHPLSHYGDLHQSDFVSDYFDPSVFTNDGVMFNFINLNCANAATIIGSSRSTEKNYLKIIGYITQYEQMIKLKAVQRLQFHLGRTQCGAGVGETISMDDYSISFMLGSLSAEAKEAHPFSRQEAPISWIALPGMVSEYTWFRNKDGTPNKSALVNVYIQLLEPAKRLGPCLRKEEENKKMAEVRANYPPSKRPYNGGGGRRNFSQLQQQLQQQQQQMHPMQPSPIEPERVAILEEQFKQFQQANAFPVLPVNQPPKQWHTETKQKEAPMP
jgi:hypothetical protein